MKKGRPRWCVVGLPDCSMFLCFKWETLHLWRVLHFVTDYLEVYLENDLVIMTEQIDRIEVAKRTWADRESMPLKLCTDWFTNGSVFSETSTLRLTWVWYGQCVNSRERWGIGKFCRWKRLPKRRKVVSLEQELTVWSMLNSSFRYIGSLAGISDFGEDIVSEASSDAGGISSHDGSKSDTDSYYNTEPSIISAISSSFNRKEL